MYPVSPLWPEPPSAPAIIQTWIDREGWASIDRELGLEVPIYWEARHFDFMLAHVWCEHGIRRVPVPMDIFTQGGTAAILAILRGEPE